jgi:transcriptional regulator of acetoin/glycerol metabolism
MVDIISQQAEELRLRERSLRGYTMKERADFDTEPAPKAQGWTSSPRSWAAGPRSPPASSRTSSRPPRPTWTYSSSAKTGTGKQLAAEAVHAHSARAGKPIISINCGALDENLLLDTLFGHIKGAFTDSRADRKGAFVEAHGGTLFLDEIQAASPKVQQALLRPSPNARSSPWAATRR